MNLFIYCAGGLGREMCDLAERNNRWDSIYFVDDVKQIDTYYNKSLYKFDNIKTLFNNDDIEFIIANGEPFIREILFNKIKDAGYRLATIIDSRAVVSPTAIIKEGTVVCNNCFVSSDVCINENCLLQPSCNLGHDTVIGSNSMISSFVCIAGACNIGKNVYIGMSVPVKEKASIGEGAIIGMGSSVVRNIGDYMIALGNPAREMKKNENKRVFS